MDKIAGKSPYLSNTAVGQVSHSQGSHPLHLPRWSAILRHPVQNVLTLKHEIHERKTKPVVEN